MTELTITELSTGKYKATFDDGGVRYFDSEDIAYLWVNITNPSCLAVVMHFRDDRHPWEMNLTGCDGNWKVNSVLGENPGDLNDLGDMLAALKIVEI